MKYAIWQNLLSDQQVDQVNAGIKVAAFENKCAITRDFKDHRIGSNAYHGVMKGFYQHVADIEATSPEHVFHIGNIGPESAITRFSRMSSLSVGDVIVDEDGQCMVVANQGFVAFWHEPKMTAANHDMKTFLEVEV